MGWVNRRLFRLPSSESRLAREIDDELRFHLESRVADLIAGGATAADARRAADSEFGDIRASRAELGVLDSRRLRRERRADALDVIAQDLKYAWRGLARQPGFAAIVVITLALAVGANSAAFSIVDPLLFRMPAGLADPGSLRRVYLSHPGSRSGQTHQVGSRFSYPEYHAIRAATAGSARVAAYVARDSVPLVRGADTTFAGVGFGTADFLPLLGVQADVGRLFTEDEDQVEAPANSAVLSRGLAARLFGSGVNPLGQVFRLKDRTFTVVGIARQSFTGIDMSRIDLWVPFSTSRPVNAPDAHSWYTRGDSYMGLIARLDRSESDAAFAAAATVADRSVWESDEPELATSRVLTGSIIEARGPAAPRQEFSISTRLAIVALIVLLVACANVANLLLLRTSSRRREIAVRLALGVSRRRLASQVLTETLLLACLAGIAALVAAWWAGGALRTALLPRTHWAGGVVTGRVLVFTVAMTLAAGCAVALAPLGLAGRRDFGAALAVGARDGALARSRTRAVLLAIQVAFSMVLVAGASLFVRSLRNVEDVPLGVDARHTVVALVQFDDRKPHPEIGTVMPTVVARVGSMSSVAAVASGSGAPFMTVMEDRLLPEPANVSASIDADFNAVNPGYFEAAGTRIVKGRRFTAADAAGAQPVMIVSQRTADQLWPGQDPLDKCARADTPTSPCMRVIGIAEDAHLFRVTDAWSPQYYVPLAQSHLRAPALTIRATGGAAHDVALLVRGELRRDFRGAVITAEPVAEAMQPELRPWRLGAALFGALGLLSLIVAAIGLYGVVAFAVQQRTRELGIRMALGARGTDVLRAIARHSLAPVLVGIGAGALITLVAARFVASLLWGVSPRDPASIGVAAAVLAIAAMLASFSPARRAVHVDPVRALREE